MSVQTASSEMWIIHFYHIPSSEILEFPSVINFDDIMMLKRYIIDRIINWLFFIWKISYSDASEGVKKTRAAHSFFQHLTTHTREIFFISKLTSWLSSICHRMRFVSCSARYRKISTINSSLLLMTQWVFVAKVYQDQTAQNMQSNLWSTLSTPLS